MVGSSIVDVAIGLALVYFILALVCSSISEFVAQLLGLRARYLRAGLQTLLGARLDEFYEHPHISSLGKIAPTGWWGRIAAALKPTAGASLHPSYVPSRAFSLALLDTVAPAGEPVQGAAAARPVLTFDEVRAAIAALPIPEAELRRALLVCFDAANYDLDQARRNVEQWFDNSMERVSGWYKRRIQWILLGLGLLATLILNVDTAQIAAALWKSPQLRSALVASAQGSARNLYTLDKTRCDPKSEDCTKHLAEVEARLVSIDAQLKLLQSEGLPIGWNTCPSLRPAPATQTVTAKPAHEAPPTAGLLSAAMAAPLSQAPAAALVTSDCSRGGSDWIELRQGFWLQTGEPPYVAKFLGLLITALAVSFGAPFWFDLINKFLNLRGSGDKPAK
ncbi:MAG TPA: hypothetical protein VHA82_09660 [Ramlibacter sp.]|uniref:hypothetical protein n=1 Tax=Ramlibacter sp. TaxID=1917967 RepID=UPI002B9DCD0E|nr:hypothetical protein [Ramlibacter sp.]HVZ44066.1 hypothetical protein [Ramlibacter sp.]